MSAVTTDAIEVPATIDWLYQDTVITVSEPAVLTLVIKVIDGNKPVESVIYCPIVNNPNTSVLGTVTVVLYGYTDADIEPELEVTVTGVP